MNAFGVDDGRYEISKKFNPPASGDTFSDDEWNKISEGYASSKKGKFAQHRAKKHMSNHAVRAGTRRAPTAKIDNTSAEA